MSKQTSIQLPEVTRRQIYDLAVRWGITDQPYDGKARYMSETIKQLVAQIWVKELQIDK